MTRLLRILWLVLPAACGRAGAAPPPNVVLIISDDHAWTDYGFMGHGIVQTPNLDRLASQSRCFRNGYVPSSLCCPSLATIITGRYPHQHGITGNDPATDHTIAGATAAKPEFAAGRERMRKLVLASPTLPQLLAQKAGYRSLQTGKWWLGSWADGGFTEGMTVGDIGKGGRHGDAGLDIGRKGMAPIYDFARRAKADGKPFLVWYAPFLPHDPHTPPDDLLKKYAALEPNEHIAKYYAMIEWLDRTCGELLDFLDRENLAENTIVAYVADNGWIQDPAAEKYAPRSKQSPYDGGLRTPILLRWPGKVTPSAQRELAHTIDIMPTLLNACGLEVPRDLPGVDLFRDGPIKWRERIFGACFDHDMADFDAPAKSLKYRWCRQGNLKLILPSPRITGARPELYDLGADPLEIRDLAGERPEEVAAMSKRIQEWWAAE